jgi:hypothetical protein
MKRRTTSAHKTCNTNILSGKELNKSLESAIALGIKAMKWMIYIFQARIMDRSNKEHVFIIRRRCARVRGISLVRLH